jgi:hypothetical protein
MILPQSPKSSAAVLDLFELTTIKADRHNLGDTKKVVTSVFFAEARPQASGHTQRPARTYGLPLQAGMTWVQFMK